MAAVSAFSAPADAGADDPDEIEAQLIGELGGFTATPEGEFAEGASGPFDLDELAAVMGIEPELLPPSIAGYSRLFASDHFEGHAVVVMGVDITGLNPDGVLDGFSAAGDRDEGPEQLFVDGEPPLDGLVSYGLHVPGADGGSTRVEITAFVANDLLIAVEVLGNVDGIATLRRAVKAQIELTPPTVTPGVDAPAATDDPDDPDATDGPDAEVPGTAEDGDESVAAGGSEAADARTLLGGDRTATSTSVLHFVAATTVVGLVVLVAAGSGRRKRMRSVPPPPPTPPTPWQIDMRPAARPTPVRASGRGPRDSPPPPADDWTTPA